MIPTAGRATRVPGARVQGPGSAAGEDDRPGAPAVGGTDEAGRRVSRGSAKHAFAWQSVAQVVSRIGAIERELRRVILTGRAKRKRGQSV